MALSLLYGPAAYYKQYKSRLKFVRRVVEVLREDGLEALREAKALESALTRRDFADAYEAAHYYKYTIFAAMEELRCPQPRSSSPDGSRSGRSAPPW